MESSQEANKFEEPERLQLHCSEESKESNYANSIDENVLKKVMLPQMLVLFKHAVKYFCEKQLHVFDEILEKQNCSKNKPYDRNPFIQLQIIEDFIRRELGQTDLDKVGFQKPTSEFSLLQFDDFIQELFQMYNPNNYEGFAALRNSQADSKFPSLKCSNQIQSFEVQVVNNQIDAIMNQLAIWDTGLQKFVKSILDILKTKEALNMLNQAKIKFFDEKKKLPLIKGFAVCLYFVDLLENQSTQDTLFLTKKTKDCCKEIQEKFQRIFQYIDPLTIQYLKKTFILSESENLQIKLDIDNCEREICKEQDELEPQLSKLLGFPENHQYRSYEEIFGLPRYSNMINVFAQIKHRVCQFVLKMSVLLNKLTIQLKENPDVEYQGKTPLEFENYFGLWFILSKSLSRQDWSFMQIKEEVKAQQSNLIKFRHSSRLMLFQNSHTINQPLDKILEQCSAYLKTENFLKESNWTQQLRDDSLENIDKSVKYLKEFDEILVKFGQAFASDGHRKLLKKIFKASKQGQINNSAFYQSLQLAIQFVQSQQLPQAASTSPNEFFISQKTIEVTESFKVFLGESNIENLSERTDFKMFKTSVFEVAFRLSIEISNKIEKDFNFRNQREGAKAGYLRLVPSSLKQIIIVYSQYFENIHGGLIKADITSKHILAEYQVYFDEILAQLQQNPLQKFEGEQNKHFFFLAVENLKTVFQCFSYKLNDKMQGVQIKMHDSVFDIVEEMQKHFEDPELRKLIEASKQKFDEIYPLFFSIKQNIKGWETVLSAFYKKILEILQREDTKNWIREIFMLTDVDFGSNSILRSVLGEACSIIFSMATHNYVDIQLDGGTTVNDTSSMFVYSRKTLEVQDPLLVEIQKILGGIDIDNSIILIQMVLRRKVDFYKMYFNIYEEKIIPTMISKSLEVSKIQEKMQKMREDTRISLLVSFTFEDVMNYSQNVDFIDEIPNEQTNSKNYLII